MYDGYLQRLDQLQLRLKQSLRTRISDNKQLVQARTHQLVQLSPITKIQRYQDRLGQLDKLYVAKWRWFMMPRLLSQETFRSSTDVGYQSNRGAWYCQKKESVVDSVESLKKKDHVTLLMREWPK